MNRYVFPYGIKFRENGRIEIFPAAEIFVSGKNGLGMSTIFHIDSGATTSVMPSSDAETLGISRAGGHRMTVRGITREELPGYRHDVMLRFKDATLKVPVIFVENDETPRVLGREGVFPQFGILFYEAERSTALLDISNKKLRGVLDGLIEGA